MARYNLKDAPSTTPEEHEAAARASCGKLLADPVVKRKLPASRVIAKSVYFHDELRGEDVTVDLTIYRRMDDIEIITRPCDPEPGLEIIESRITGHIYRMVKLNFMTAMTRGLIKVNGPIRTAMKLLPIVKPGFACYRETLRKVGYEDLLAFPSE